MAIEISIPFNVGEDGKIDTVSGPNFQIRQHVMALINTSPTERVMLPTYGVAANTLIFEDADPLEIGVQVSSMITNAFSEWEPGVQLVEVVPDAFPGDNITQVDVLWRRLDAADSDSAANVNTAIIGADGTVKDIISG